ncbi:MAG TPA: BREX system Lon protease-like protein BrxL [Thermotogota bacterium]|nr:BREX system Lon protease-like protein BrxL [Thermotogota bacterium]HRW92404.1 BREX system Lon protease-like protein BrxL [Thermotogota bacterium]
MTRLDQKINQHFSGLVVRKDLVKAVRGNAIVPSYVLEYLLGQYCATSDEDSIQGGIETVKEILRKHYVHRNEAGLVKSRVREQGRVKLIDKIAVELNDKADIYVAEFSNLGLKNVRVDPDTVKRHPKLLVNGVWCIAELEYQFTEEKNGNPWVMASIKPIQLSRFDFEGYLQARRQFSTEEWIDLLVQSVGFDPELLGRRSKLLLLTRLVPYCERNYNLVELGPKGTGKSHIYSEFSPHGILLSGGEVTVAKLFVNNSTGRIGLVGYWDTVAFDEFAGRQKRVDKALVDILKNYMANKSFSRGIETLGAEASMVFVGNTQHTVPYMLKHSDLFCDLPEKFYDSAFLDRIHFYVPGWEVDIIRGEMFTCGYGFVVDYLAEILRSLRNHDFSDRYTTFFSLCSDLSTRDRDGIQKTFSGLMKILFPHGEARAQEVEELLRFSMEGRKRVKDQLMRIDTTYPPVHFSYSTPDGQEFSVQTLEEKEFAQYYGAETPPLEEQTSPQPAEKRERDPVETHLVFQENQQGVCYDNLFADYLRGAHHITLTDPYIRLFYQVRNLMEFLETVAKAKPRDEEISVHLLTTRDDLKPEPQEENLKKIQQACEGLGIHFSWAFDPEGTIHARHIVLDNGWKILLDRGLDIFQHYEMNDAFSFSNRLQQYRSCKAFEMTALFEPGGE